MTKKEQMAMASTGDNSKKTDLPGVSESKTLARTAMIVGIIGVLTAWLFASGLPFALTAIVLASVALIRRRPGRPFALSGLILGVIGTVIGVGALIWMAGQVYEAWYTTVKTEEVTVRQIGSGSREQRYFTSGIVLGKTTLEQVEKQLGRPTATQQGPLVSSGRHPEIESREYRASNMVYYVYYKDAVAVKKFTQQEAQAHRSIMQYP